MDEKQFNDLVAKVGKEAAEKIRTEMTAHTTAVEKTINDRFTEVQKGLLKAEDFEKFKTEEIGKLGEQLKQFESILKEQGTVLTSMKENSPAQPKSLEDVLSNPETIKAIKAIQSARQGNIEIPLKGVSLKTAGMQSVGNGIAPMTPPPNSPYLPAAAPLDATNFFGLIYNPNFIINYVNRGRTNFFLLPWVNETSTEGAAASVQEGAQKPLWNTRFKVEISEAKKIAAMTSITEEWDKDLPGFTTIVQRLLQEEVSRKWDDAVYAAVIAVAQGYTMTGLNNKIDDANYWDALRALVAQIGKNNFTANFIGVNPVTSALIDMQKSAQDRLYLVPPFAARINSILREGNKVAEDLALVGDIMQYNVDVYQDLSLRVGYNDDDFRRNQFSVVVEVRYHDYISNNRKPAIVYKDLSDLVTQLDSGS